MVKASSFFGGTNPTDHSKPVRQKGNNGNSSGGGLNITRKTGVKQVGHSSSNGQTSHLNHKAISRPNLPGKEDNRHKG